MRVQSNIEWRVLSWNGQMALNVKVNDPHLQYQLRESQDAYLVQFKLIFITGYLTNKPNFLEFYVKMAKMTLKVTMNDLHFQYQLRLSQNACLLQILWF